MKNLYTKIFVLKKYVEKLKKSHRMWNTGSTRRIQNPEDKDKLAARPLGS